MTGTPIPHVTAVTLGVRDVETATRFYTEGLGFRPVSRMGDEIAFVQAGHGLLLALWNIESMPGEYGDVGHGPLAPPMSLGHNVSAAEHVDKLYHRALDAGATSIGAPKRQEWGGVSACVADPDGFRWDFVYNPAFTVDADGEITGV
ncbi:VOC family protein [Gordonia sp. PP30]|uniref:VOC family protein n=1 Tax=Gordonia sp. PP30 TaxID=2935861 RepID=UPI00200057A7|nr:VOC family protein [Gordonia sp. PP30]UQE73483.1 VOC family protein [Gordonia sp. PP30]